MGRLAIAMRIGFVWAIISFLTGCSLIHECERKPEWIYPRIDSQNKNVEQLTAKLKQSQQANLALKQSQQANLALKKENETLMIDTLRLMNANSKLQQNNLELTTKIDMLKTLNHRVEEKRKNYSSD